MFISQFLQSLNITSPKIEAALQDLLTAFIEPIELRARDELHEEVLNGLETALQNIVSKTAWDVYLEVDAHHALLQTEICHRLFFNGLWFGLQNPNMLPKNVASLKSDIIEHIIGLTGREYLERGQAVWQRFERVGGTYGMGAAKPLHDYMMAYYTRVQWLVWETAVFIGQYISLEYQ